MAPIVTAHRAWIAAIAAETAAYKGYCQTPNAATLATWQAQGQRTDAAWDTYKQVARESTAPLEARS